MTQSYFFRKQKNGESTISFCPLVAAKIKIFNEFIAHDIKSHIFAAGKRKNYAENHIIPQADERELG